MAAAAQLPPAPPSARLERLEGGATAEGVEFERKVAGLAALRSRRLGVRFQVFSNVAAARPLDDVVLRLAVPPPSSPAAATGSAADQQALGDTWATYFLQLKHTGTKALSLKSFTTNKHFHLKKYFEFFVQLRGWHQKKQNPQEALEGGQRLLCEGPLEHCRFVIFTTQQRWVRASTAGAADEHVHQMAREILDSGAASDCVLRFTHNDRTVWDLFKGDANEGIYQKEFLPKLLIYCEQTESGQLDSLIKREIKTLLGDPLLQLDLLTFHFLEFLKDWMRDNAKDFCLTEDSAEVEWYLAEHLRGEARKACALELLQFQETHWGPLREALQREGALLLQVAGVPAGARAAKLLGILDAEHQGAWVYVNAHVLSQFDTKALKAVCCARHCQVLVVDVDHNSKNLNDFLQAVATSVKIVSLGKVNLGRFGVMRHQEQLVFSQLTSDSQDELLERTVSFQGQAVRLRQLEGAWPGLREEVDGALLGAVALGEAALGDPLPPVSEEVECEEEQGGERLYIPRSLRHMSEMDPAVLRLASSQDHLVLAGIPQTSLEVLRRTFGWSAEEMKDRWSTLESDSPAKMEKAFDAVCSKLSPRNVHWLECLGPHDNNVNETALTLVWRRTRGRGDALAPLVRPATHACAREPECVHGAARAPADVAAWGRRASLLVGGPGAGKTSFMLRAAAEARRRAPARWTVFVQAQEHRKRLLEMPSAPALKLAHLEQLLAAAAGVGSSAVATERCVRAALSTGAVGVMVDGVDELCPAFKDKVLRLLQLLLRETKAAPVWVTSRPEVQASLQSVLGGSCTLTPLTRQEQCQFLTTRFAHETSLPAQEGAERILDAIANHVPEDSEAGSLLATPLHLKMVAEIFIDAEADSLEGQWALGVYELFRKFVRRKEDVYLEKHGFRNANIECAPFYQPDYFSLVHQKCAMFLLVSDKRFKDVDPQPFEDYVDENREVLLRMKTGLMWLGDDRAPRFAHHTLVEYFAAAWLSANVAREAAARTVARSLVAGANRGGGGSLMLLFLDEMLAEDPSLHSAGHHAGAADTAEDCLLVEEADNAALPAPGEEPCGRGSASVLQVLFAQGRSPLHLAAGNGLAACARALVRRGADVDSADAAGRTPLHLAAARGHRSVMAVLSNAEANINARTNQGDTALALAAQNGHLDCVIFLGSQCHSLDVADKHGETPLHRAAAHGHSIVTRILLEGGADVNARSAEERTPLMLAAGNGDRYSVEVLLARGAAMRAADAGGRTALHVAAEQGQLIAVRVLLNANADVTTKTTEGKTPHALAAGNGHWNCVRDLLDDGADVGAVDNKGHTPLHAAAEGGHLVAVYGLLEYGAVVDAKSAEGKTPLALAAGNGHTDIVRELLKRGADVGAVDNKGHMPHHAAAQGGHSDALYGLLEFGAIVDAKCTDGKTPLMLAAGNGRTDIVRELLKRGADVGAVDNKGHMPHHAAAQGGHSDTLYGLLEFGAVVDPKSTEGKTPLMLAAGKGHTDIVRELLKRGADVKAASNERHTPLHAAAEAGHFNTVRVLLDAKAEVNAKTVTGKTPLRLAASNKYYHCIDLLIGRGAKVDAADREGFTPLHVAALKGHLDTVRVLLDAKAEVNAKIAEENIRVVLPGSKEHWVHIFAMKVVGKTPLMLAVLCGHADCADLLLERGAGVSYADCIGRTALHAAAQGGHLTAVRRLLGAKAEVNAKTDQGKTPLMLAAGHGQWNVFRDLLDCGADVGAADIAGLTPLHAAAQGGHLTAVRVLLGAKAEVNAKTARGKTPLMLAAYKKHWDCVRDLRLREVGVGYGRGYPRLHAAAESGHISTISYLLKTGADVNVMSVDGKTPLVLAAGSGHADCVDLLLKGGADVGAVDSRGLTPLHVAAGGGHQNAVRILLDSEADVNATTAEGKTPLELATGNRHKDCVDLLLKR